MKYPCRVTNITSKWVLLYNWSIPVNGSYISILMFDRRVILNVEDMKRLELVSANRLIEWEDSRLNLQRSSFLSLHLFLSLFIAQNWSKWRSRERRAQFTKPLAQRANVSAQSVSPTKLEPTSPEHTPKSHTQHFCFAVDTVNQGCSIGAKVPY